MIRRHTESDGSIMRFAPRDLTSRLAYVIGFRDYAYRQMAVNALRLKRGDHVVEIGCGTGRNFVLLERAVGSDGLIIAVDFSQAMLERARKRAARHAWLNIELVHSDAASYAFPTRVDGILFTYSLVVIPEYDRVVERACEALKPGKNCVVLDQKIPSGALSRLVPLLEVLSRPLDYSYILGNRRPWESMRRHAGNVRVKDLYFGFVYLAVSEKNADDARNP